MLAHASDVFNNMDLNMGEKKKEKVLKGNELFRLWVHSEVYAGFFQRGGGGGGVNLMQAEMPARSEKSHTAGKQKIKN